MRYDYNNIMGHEDVIEYFRKTIESKNISHSYLLQGSKGIGKELLAKTFAKTLLCEEKDRTDPCNKCTSCIMMETGNNPDYFEVFSKKASIGVDDIREQVVEQMDIKPYRSKYKIFMIAAAERMTIQAQNALLKTIEEPPGYGIVILITKNPSKIINTVHSRCARIRVLPLPTKIIKEYIQNNHGLEEWEAGLYADFSDGSLSKAKEMVEGEEFWDMRQKAIDYIIKLENADLMELYDMAAGLDNERDNLPQILDFWIIWYRDVLMYKVFENEEYILYKDFKNLILDRSKELTYNRINDNFYEIIRAKERLDKNINVMLIIENLLLEIKERTK
ncbi:MAG TPA: DNA polymerase III subunit delta' [Epulopiscium sp.]|nr:DNA polymerase III subunit delta' [Candidatus Epulonipiscium sp.]